VSARLLPIVLLLGLCLAAPGCASPETGNGDAGGDDQVGDVEPGELSPEEALEVFRQGVESARDGEVDRAMELLQRAADARPGFMDPLLVMGTLEESRGNWDAARAHFMAAIEVDPTFTAVGVRIGLTFVAEQRLDEARVWFVRAIEADPGSFQAHYNLGTLCVQTAERHAERGDLAAAEAARQEAAEWYRVAAALEPRDIDAPTRLAKLRLEAGDAEGALEAAEIALARAGSLRGGKETLSAKLAAEVAAEARKLLER